MVLLPVVQWDGSSLCRGTVQLYAWPLTNIVVRQEAAPPLKQALCCESSDTWKRSNPLKSRNQNKLRPYNVNLLDDKNVEQLTHRPILQWFELFTRIYIRPCVSTIRSNWKYMYLVGGRHGWYVAFTRQLSIIFRVGVCSTFSHEIRNSIIMKVLLKPCNFISFDSNEIKLYMIWPQYRFVCVRSHV